MKKLSLSIPTPCHEDWNAMTPEAQGRFCGSCQKTVMDFTTMSDRQIAETFKKPAGEMCGRFHADQLNRDIIIPKKRIPWIRYFFQFTWPAFVLFLKSCGQKEETQGEVLYKPTVENKPDVREYKPTLGIMLPEITPVDTPKKTKVKMQPDPTSIVGELQVRKTLISDTTFVVMPVDDDTLVRECKKTLDTVTIVATNYATKGKLVIQSGAVSVTTSATQYSNDSSDSMKLSEETKLFTYPNPVQAGHVITVTVPAAKDYPKGVQLISSSGAVISRIQPNFKSKGVFTLPISSNLRAGTYFIQVIAYDGSHKTAKIIVIN